MLKVIKSITSDKLTFRGFIISFFLAIASAILIIVFYNKLPPLLPIYNQLPWGEQRIAPTFAIFIPTIIFLIIYAVNIVFISFIYNKNPLIARFVAATTLLIAILNFIYTLRTILVII